MGDLLKLVMAGLRRRKKLVFGASSRVAAANQEKEQGSINNNNTPSSPSDNTNLSLSGSQLQLSRRRRSSPSRRKRNVTDHQSLVKTSADAHTSTTSRGQLPALAAHDHKGHEAVTGGEIMIKANSVGLDSFLSKLVCSAALLLSRLETHHEHQLKLHTNTFDTIALMQHTGTAAAGCARLF